MDKDLFNEISLSTTIPEIERDEKGRILSGVAQDTNINDTAGRPCGFCENKEEILKQTTIYLEKCKVGEHDKPRIPYLEELALILNVSDVTLWHWYEKKNEDDELEHPEFFSLVAIVKTTQKFRLKQRALGRYNPSGALYLLNADHKVIQTNKEIIAGDKNEPIEITITEEDRKKDHTEDA